MFNTCSVSAISSGRLHCGIATGMFARHRRTDVYIHSTDRYITGQVVDDNVVPVVVLQCPHCRPKWIDLANDPSPYPQQRVLCVL